MPNAAAAAADGCWCHAILIHIFSFKIDITSIIRDQWNFITAHPNTWGHTISNYVNSGYIIKKLQVLSST